MATRNKRLTPAIEPEESIESLLDRENDHRAMKLAAFERLKDRLIDDGFDPALAHLHLTSLHVAIFEDFGFTKREQIVNELQKHREIADARREVGDPAVIQAAEARLGAALEAERSARAEVSELDEQSADGEPVLAKQIRNLQSRLATLTKERVDAELELSRLRAKRLNLRRLAPAAMRADIDRAIGRMTITSDVSARLKEIQPEIVGLQTVHHRWRDYERFSAEAGCNKVDPKDLVLCGHAKAYCPAAYSHGDGSPSFDRQMFARYVDDVMRPRLRALEAEELKLKDEWQSLVEEVESDIEHWVATGEVLRS